jgi:hypothetical protein
MFLTPVSEEPYETTFYKLVDSQQVTRLYLGEIKGKEYQVKGG